MKGRQIINRLIRFSNKAQGPYANKIGPKNHAAGLGQDDRGCFYVLSAEIGRPHPNRTVICFNADPDELSCGVVGLSGFSFKVDGTDILEQSYLSKDGNCLTYLTRHVVNGDGITPSQDVTYSYSPGTCHKSGEADPECALEEITDASVRNSILGIVAARVGDVADNIVVVRLGASAAVIGTRWEIYINTLQAGVTNSEIVDGNIRFTINQDVNPGDTVEISHTGTTGGAESTDGRLLYVVTDYPVVNASGVDYWIRADGGAWVTESVDRWQLEA